MPRTGATERTARPGPSGREDPLQARSLACRTGLLSVQCHDRSSLRVPCCGPLLASHTRTHRVRPAGRTPSQRRPRRRMTNSTKLNSLTLSSSCEGDAILQLCAALGHIGRVICSSSYEVEKKSHRECSTFPSGLEITLFALQTSLIEVSRGNSSGASSDGTTRVQIAVRVPTSYAWPQELNENITRTKALLV
jgi:hypothetical protein